MRYYDATKDGKALILDHYTGVGEVLAVHNLDQVFATLHQSLRVKRGILFSLDDAKNNGLIFIESPSENLTLLDVPSTKEFVFRKVNDGPRAGNMEIVNVQPGQGEPDTYIAAPGNIPLTEDLRARGAGARAQSGAFGIDPCGNDNDRDANRGRVCHARK